MSHIINVIADYGAGDPAWAEVENALVDACGPTIRIIPTAVRPRSTLNHGFWLGQHSGVRRNMVFYDNTAPRKKDEGNRGDQLVYFRLDNGNHGLEVLAGHNLSFVTPHLSVLRPVVHRHSGTAFRSRDDFPAVMRLLLCGQLAERFGLGSADTPVLGESLNWKDPNVVPLLPAWPKVKIAHVDPYGNCKLTIRTSQLPFEAGAELIVSVLRNRKPVSLEPRAAKRRRGDFDQAEVGALSVVNGSSGYDDPFIELFAYDPDPGALGASDLLGGVQVEDDVVIEPA